MQRETGRKRKHFRILLDDSGLHPACLQAGWRHTSKHTSCHTWHHGAVPFCHHRRRRHLCQRIAFDFSITFCMLPIAYISDWIRRCLSLTLALMRVSWAYPSSLWTRKRGTPRTPDNQPLTLTFTTRYNLDSNWISFTIAIRFMLMFTTSTVHCHCNKDRADILHL